MTTFVQVAEHDCVQVNLHVGIKYAYWFIQPNEYCIKLLKGEIPEYFKNYLDDEDVKSLIAFSK